MEQQAGRCDRTFLRRFYIQSFRCRLCISLSGRFRSDLEWPFRKVQPNSILPCPPATFPPECPANLQQLVPWPKSSGHYSFSESSCSLHCQNDSGQSGQTSRPAQFQTASYYCPESFAGNPVDYPFWQKVHGQCSAWPLWCRFFRHRLCIHESGPQWILHAGCHWNSERRSQHSWKAPHFYTSLNECTFIQGCSSYNVYTIFCKGMQAVFLLGFFAL